MKEVMQLHANKVRIVGYVLFTLSFLLWGVIFMLPFFIKNVPKMLAINTVLLIVSEGSFALSVFILGKEFWQKIKSFFKNIIKKS